MGLWKQFLKQLPIFLYWLVAIGTPAIAFIMIFVTNSIWSVIGVFAGLGLLSFMIWVWLDWE